MSRAHATPTGRKNPVCTVCLTGLATVAVVLVPVSIRARSNVMSNGGPGAETGPRCYLHSLAPGSETTAATAAAARRSAGTVPVAGVHAAVAGECEPAEGRSVLTPRMSTPNTPRNLASLTERRGSGLSTRPGARRSSGLRPRRRGDAMQPGCFAFGWEINGRDGTLLIGRRGKRGLKLRGLRVFFLFIQAF